MHIVTTIYENRWEKSPTYLINGYKHLLHESSQYIIYIISIFYTCIILFVYNTYRV